MFEVEQMPAFELAEWASFLAHEPQGEARADWRSAMQANVLAHVNDNRQSRIEHFMPPSLWPDDDS